MIKTNTGRVSRTQLLHIASVMLQGANVSLFQAFGLTPEHALIIATLLGIAQSGIGAYLRTITHEQII
jgi:uncharacterized membrane protein